MGPWEMLYNIISADSYKFSGHESFSLRYTWIPKAIRVVLEEPTLFEKPDAMVLLGVGKNMVSSIRYWVETMNLVTRTAQGIWEPTPLGTSLFHPETGLDPYLEDVATLWLLHSLLAKRGSRASTWHLVFSRFPYSIFSREQLLSWLREYTRTHQVKVSPNTLKRDVDVFLRTYVAPKNEGELYEDLWDCPLAELDLIKADGQYFQILQTSRETLSSTIFEYVLVSYWQHYYPTQRTLSFETIMYAPGSPGSIFKLTEDALVQRLRNLSNTTNLVYDDTAGLRQVLSRQTITDLNANTLLEPLYHNQNVF